MENAGDRRRRVNSCGRKVFSGRADHLRLSPFPTVGCAARPCLLELKAGAREPPPRKELQGDAWRRTRSSDRRPGRNWSNRSHARGDQRGDRIPLYRGCGSTRRRKPPANSRNRPTPRLPPERPDLPRPALRISRCSAARPAIERGKVPIAELTAREFALTLDEALQLVLLYAAHDRRYWSGPRCGGSTATSTSAKA